LSCGISRDCALLLVLDVVSYGSWKVVLLRLPFPGQWAAV
jgi:hypothetical protein